MSESELNIERLSKTGLRPCPFCSGTSLSLVTVGEKQTPVCIECEDCGATGPQSSNPDQRSIELLRLLWDTRRMEV